MLLYVAVCCCMLGAAAHASANVDPTTPAESQTQTPTQAESKLQQSRDPSSPQSHSPWMSQLKPTSCGMPQVPGATRQRLNKQFSLISDNAHAETRCWLQKKWSTWQRWHATLAKAQHRDSSADSFPPTNSVSELLACSWPEKCPQHTQKIAKNRSAFKSQHVRELTSKGAGWKTCYQMPRRTTNCQADRGRKPKKKAPTKVATGNLNK